MNYKSFKSICKDHVGAVVTHSLQNSEAGSSNPKPYVRKMVVTSVVGLQYRTLTNCMYLSIFCPQKLYSVESDIKPQINKIVTR